MLERRWQLQEAKNKFSRLVELARQDGPQIVTKHGQEAAVLLSIDEYRRLVRPKTSLVQFFQKSPLADIELDLTRSKETSRDIEL
jgi:antitoxin Phd